MDATLVTEHACKVAQFVASAAAYTSATEASQPETTSHDGIRRLMDTLIVQTDDIRFFSAENTGVLSTADEAFLRIVTHSQKLSRQLSRRFQKLQRGANFPRDFPSSAEIVESCNDSEQLLNLIRTDLNDIIAKIQWLEVSQVAKELGARNLRLNINRTAEIQDLTFTTDANFREIGKKDVNDARKLELWLEIRDAMRKAAEFSIEQAILTTLHFWTMERRRDFIPKQHEDTFSWLLSNNGAADASDPEHNFTAWLTGNEPLYWISGKPGSGKSTLTKFISQSPEVIQGLNKWAGDDELIIAEFYFWSSATDKLQKSGTGLLRSILFQILRQCPGLIQYAFPKEWQHRKQYQGLKNGNKPAEFGVPGLLAAYDCLVAALPGKGAKLCFFLDGLDEYDGQPTDMINLIQSLLKTDKLKVCLSSRPWADFETVFGGASPWKLYMHELTKTDIQVYAEALLNENEKLGKLIQVDEEGNYRSLVQKLVTNAEGVFLWVFLVVRDLLHGLADTDGIPQLESRLNEIPNDLDGYFNQMFCDVQPEMREEMAHILQVALNAADKLPLLTYWLIKINTSESARDMKLKPFLPSMIKNDLIEMLTWLDKYSHGLLIAKNSSSQSDDLADVEDHQWLFDFRVDFMHRTMTDFLRTTEMEKLLREWSAKSFNVDAEICKAGVATLKVTPPTAAMFNDVSRALATLHLSMSHAQLLTENSATEILNEMLLALRQHGKTLRDLQMWILGPGNYWAYQCSFDFAFLFHCFSYGLGDYVALQLDLGELQFREPSSGILSGCFSRDPRLRTGDFTPAADAIDLLLQRKLDPNLPWGDRDFSFWQQLVTTTYSRHLKGILTEADLDAVSSAIKYGSNRDAPVEILGARRMGKITAIEIVEKVFPDIAIPAQ